jgi:hypothetical protein
MRICADRSGFFVPRVADCHRSKERRKTAERMNSPVADYSAKGMTTRPLCHQSRAQASVRSRSIPGERAQACRIAGHPQPLALPRRRKLHRDDALHGRLEGWAAGRGHKQSGLDGVMEKRPERDHLGMQDLDQAGLHRGRSRRVPLRGMCGAAGRCSQQRCRNHQAIHDHPPYPFSFGKSPKHPRRHCRRTRNPF